MQIARRTVRSPWEVVPATARGGEAAPVPSGATADDVSAMVLDATVEAPPERPGPWRTLGFAFMTALSVAGCSGGGPAAGAAAAAASQAAGSASQVSPAAAASQAAGSASQVGPATAAGAPHAASTEGQAASAAAAPTAPGVPEAPRRPAKPYTAADYERVYEAVPLLRPQQKGQHPAVRVELVAPTTSPEDLARLVARYETNVPVIDAMIDRDATPQQRADIQRDLGILPPAMLQAAQKAGVRIWVADRSVLTVPVRLFQSEGPDPATDRVEGDKNVVAAPFSLRARGSEYRLETKEGIRELKALKPQAGDTIEDLARLRGATTPEQVADFARLAVKMNKTPFGPALDTRRPLAEGETLRVPDLAWYQGQPVSLIRIGSIRSVNDSLATKTVGGSYNHVARLLMVRGDVIQDPAKRYFGGGRVVVHEFGHVADALFFDDLSAYSRHFEQMKALHTTAMAKVEKGDFNAIITDYAQTSIAEHYAEAFEAYFTADRPDPSHHVSPDDGNFRQLQKREAGFVELVETEARMYEQGQVHPKDLRYHPRYK